jgi:hypothetical protein
MTAPAQRTIRPGLKYLVAAGLVGFIVGAFVVASLGNQPWARGARAKPTDTLIAAVLDDAGSPVVEADLVRRLGRHLVRSVAPVLELQQGEEAIWEGYDQQLRRSVRRAGKSGVLVDKGRAHFGTFFDLYTAQSREWSVPWHHQRDRLEAMLAVLGDQAEIWVASYEGQSLCAQLALYRPERDMHFWISGARREARPLAAYHFLLHEIILDAGRRGFTECHFGASLGNPEVEHFKLAYGGAPRPLLRFFHQPRWVGWVQKLRW